MTQHQRSRDSAGAYAKHVHVDAGMTLGQHAHPYTHLSVLASGRATVTCEGVVKHMRAPVCMTIPAGVEHSVHAITDIDWFCMHVTGDTDPTTVDASILTPR